MMVHYTSTKLSTVRGIIDINILIGGCNVDFRKLAVMSHQMVLVTDILKLRSVFICTIKQSKNSSFVLPQCQ